MSSDSIRKRDRNPNDPNKKTMRKKTVRSDLDPFGPFTFLSDPDPSADCDPTPTSDIPRNAKLNSHFPLFDFCHISRGRIESFCPRNRNLIELFC